MQMAMSLHPTDRLTPKLKAETNLGVSKANYLQLQMEGVDVVIFFPTKEKLYLFLNDLRGELTDILYTFGA